LSCSGNEQPAEIAVSDSWTREIAPGQSAAAVYLKIANSGAGSDRLIGVEAGQGEASLHSTTSSGGVSRMRPLEGGIEIAPRSTVELKPGGTHIMLTGLATRPAAGQSIGLTLRFERSGEQPVSIRVVPAASGDGHAGHGM
jgi:copper(I)-binding protein